MYNRSNIIDHMRGMMSMDGKINITELRDLVEAFVRDRNWESFHNPKDLSMALSVEASELMDLYLWDREPDIERVKEEMADVLIYLLELSSRTGIDLSDAVEKKLEKNDERYPVDKCRGRSEKYDKL